MTRSTDPQQPGPREPVDPPGGEEHDPTGMRALLSSLPDPGPMPEHLAARIHEHIAAEAAATADRRASDPSPTSRPHDALPARDREPDGVLHLTSPRRRLSAGRVLGGVAAAALVVTGGAALLTGTVGGFSGGPTVAGDAAVSEVAPESSTGSSPESATESAESPVAPRTQSPYGDGLLARVVATGAEYRTATLGTDAAVLVTTSAPGLASDAAPTDGGAVSTPAGALACASALGVTELSGIVVDIASVDGRPAAVLVAEHKGEHTAYAVGRDCAAGNPHLLAGPVPVPSSGTSAP